ncbi:ZPR1 zinc finger domain-containing protein [Hyperthermus butylicus]|uniref:Conserved archaeal protein n=1 Tax=Hyperthermus butylicus (strain DSM 5456 / JCM 9403 / PLM1-5) TaxID=415426 RepID=A2BM80_HYPBU|nr:ZPR1 zinc finger domain-containing protein [Hyperthermus butylicus]ABM81091.1 conserved archaeal protein [Hyperthermus butylicus DSM 5456]
MTRPEKQHREKLVKINELVVECPVCSRKTLRIEDYLYDMPLVGKVLLTSAKCNSCGYRFTDVRLAEAHGPRKIVYRVEKPEDLNVIVVKASSASIVVPELDLKMMPGPAATGFITTVEGVFDRFLEALEAACSSPDADREACKRARKLILDAKEGRVKFTLVIVDPEGISAIVSEKARVEPVKREELEELGYIVA